MSALITKSSKKLTENILLPCCGTNVLLNSSLTRQLVYLLEQLLNVIFHLFDLPGIGTLTLVVNSKQHIHSLWNHFLDTCLVSWFSLKAILTYVLSRAMSPSSKALKKNHNHMNAFALRHCCRTERCSIHKTFYSTINTYL